MTIIGSSLCFFMVGYLTSLVINGNTEIPYFKLLLYTMFGVYFLHQYTNEIKQS
jgi:hypothetical protein